MTADSLEAKQPSGGNTTLLCLLLAVLFTPGVRLPGNVPIRADDLIVFWASAILIARRLLGRPTPKLDRVFVYTAVLVATILLSTALAPDNVDITAKEYLDCFRPIKFFLAYWLVRDCDPAASLRTFLRTMSVASFVLLAMTCVEMVFARVAPGSIVVRFFSAFTEKSPDFVLDMMATRPFATFNTPPDLGYVACVCLFAGPLISSPRRRKIFVITFFMILLVTATRILLFSLPLLLILQAFLRAKNVKEAFRRMRLSLSLIVLAGLSTAILLPIISPQASEFTQGMIVAAANGDTSDEDSISTRLGNFYLVDYTWSQAPFFGVGTRSLLPDFVDSELILTFHRYGVIGLATLLLFYPLGFSLARHVAGSNPELYQFAVLALVTTFLAGITLGALSNSRIGVLVFIIVGLVRASKRADAAISSPCSAVHGSAFLQQISQGGISCREQS